MGLVPGAVPFEMVPLSAAELVFEKPADDFPTSIVYRRSDDRVIATDTGPGGADAQT